jgi:hypothetical protein
MNLSNTVLPALERLQPHSVLAAGALGVALALSPLFAQASNNDSKATATQDQQQKGKESDQKSSADTKAADKAPNDLVSCKRDADGMRGPERSRFMTACLRERK